MTSEENKKTGEETSGDQVESGPAGMDRNEGQTLNGTVGGTGSDLDSTSERLGGSEKETSDSSETGK